MWKKRSILLLLALTMACSSTLYGCDVMKAPAESGANASEGNSGEASGEDKDSGSAGKTDPNGEVFVAALGLRAPVFIRGNGDLAHGIVFDTHFLFRHNGGSFFFGNIRTCGNGDGSL